MKAKTLYIGEGAHGEAVEFAHINVLVGPRDGPAGAAFSTALATPSAGHVPFVVVLQNGVPAKPFTLFVNKAVIDGEIHANATWGAAQAGIARAVAESLLDGSLPREAENDWVIVSANWINPKVKDIDAVYHNHYHAMKKAIHSALNDLPQREAVVAALKHPHNAFYTPKASRHEADA